MSNNNRLSRQIQVTLQGKTLGMWKRYYCDDEWEAFTLVNAPPAFIWVDFVSPQWIKIPFLTINTKCARGRNTNTLMHVCGPPRRSTAHWGHCRTQQVQTVKPPLCAVACWSCTAEWWTLMSRTGRITPDINIREELCFKDVGSGASHSRCCKKTSTRFDGLVMKSKLRIASKTVIHLFHINPISSLSVARIWGHYCRDSILRPNNPLPHTAGNHWGVY